MCRRWSMLAAGLSVTIRIGATKRRRPARGVSVQRAERAPVGRGKMGPMNSGQLNGGTIEAVRDLYAQLLTAWNDRDADRFGSLFAADGESVGFDGTQSHGPQIGEHLKTVFAGHPTAAYLANVRHVRAVGPGAAVLRAIVGMVPRGGDELKPDVNAVQTLLAERV